MSTGLIKAIARLDSRWCCMIDEIEKCPKCDSLLEAEWENNGFDEPDPTKWEITSLFCPCCGWSSK